VLVVFSVDSMIVISLFKSGSYDSEFVEQSFIPLFIP